MHPIVIGVSQTPKYRAEKIIIQNYRLSCLDQQSAVQSLVAFRGGPSVSYNNQYYVTGSRLNFPIFVDVTNSVV